jgi:dolichol-phosphate mannosyltransferase
MKLSVILPTFNEADNIIGLVEMIRQHIPRACDREILIVDDNSPDGTYTRVQDRFVSDPAIRCILRKTDRGFARSIRHGIEAATGDVIIVMDTDFTHDPAEIPRLLHILEIYDVVSASRFCAGGDMQDTRHYLTSLLYNWWIRIILRTQIQDNLGGYFAMRRSRIRELPFERIFFGYGEYFMRLLHYAQRRGFSMVEIPSRYRARAQGKSKSNRLKMLYYYSRTAISLRIAALKNPGAIGPLSSSKSL